MTYRLAIELSDTVTRAAIVEDRDVRWFDLAGDDGLPNAVHQGDDGAVLVGSEAVAGAGRPGRFVPDPTGNLGADPDAVGAVAALLAHVRAAAEQRQGTAPEMVVIAHPDHWPAARTRALSAAAREAGLENFERVSAGAAVDAYRSVSGDEDRPPRAIAYGAAIVAANAASLDATAAVPLTPPIITLEDISGPLPEPPPPVTPNFATEGPSSVFEQSGAPAPPPTQALPVTPPGPPTAPPPGPPDEPPPDEGNRWVPWVVGLSVVALVLLGALVLLLATGDDDGDDVSTGSSTTSAPSTTLAIASTSSTTTSSVPETSTTSTTATSTTTTSTTTTTTSTTTTLTPTTTQAPPEGIDVEPGALVIDPDGTPRTVSIGSPGVSAIDAVSEVLGPPDSRTDFESSEFCVSPVRRVRWGGLEMVLVDDGDDTFGQWYVDDDLGAVDELRTSRDIGIGSTVGDLNAAYPLVQFSPVGGIDEQIFSVVIDPDSLVGVVSGASADDVVDAMWSGDACQRVAT